LANYTISDDEWCTIAHHFPAEHLRSARGGRPAFTNREMFQAMLYWLADGIAKRRCGIYTGVSYRTLERHLDLWITEGLFLRLWDEALACYDYFCGLRRELLFMDGAINISPNGGESTGRNPTDRAKSGSKRSLLTDTSGIPLAISIKGANRNDRVLVEETLAGARVTLLVGAELSLDAGYTGENVRSACGAAGLVARVYSRQDPPARKRYPVECAHQKFNSWRGIKVRTLRSDERWLALLYLAATVIVWRATSANAIWRK